MADTTEGEHQWVSVRQAAVLLNSSPSSIRRKIRAGDLEAEQRQRPQGSEFQVRLPASLGAPPPEEDAPVEAPDDAPPAGTDAPQAPDVASAAELHALVRELGQLWLQPMIDQLAQSSAKNDERAEMVGLLKARLEMSLSRIGEIEGERDRVRDHAGQLAREVAEERQARVLAENAVARMADALAALSLPDGPLAPPHAPDGPPDGVAGPQGQGGDPAPWWLRVSQWLGF